MPGRPAAILLLENNPDHSERMRQAFAAVDGDFSVTIVSSLAQARSRLRAVIPDLVITAASLDDGLGLELIPQPQNPLAYPVIVLTDHGSEKEAVDVLKAGALDYVVKTGTALADMPLIARHALRDWEYVIDRQRAEAALWKSEASYRTLAENLPAIVYRMFAIDLERRLFFNDMLETMTGYTPEELGVNGQEATQDHSYTRANRISSIENMIVAEERDWVMDRIREAFSKNRSFVAEYRIKDKKDHIRYFSERGKPVVDGEGMVAHMDGVIFDVTDQKRTELALRESRKSWEDKLSEVSLTTTQRNNNLEQLTYLATLAG